MYKISFFLISTQIERARSPRPGGVRRCCWVFLKGFSMRFWDFILKKNSMIEIFFQLIGFSKNPKIPDFREIQIWDFQKSDFSKIRNFQIFRKSDQLEKKSQTSKKCFFFIKPQNLIEKPFRNTQQHLLTPPGRGERALSIWVGTNKNANYTKILAEIAHRK